MGLFDLGANVVLRFKADVSEAKAAVKDLSGEEKKAAEARLKQLEAGNKALEKQSKNWQFAAQVIGGGAAAYALANKGLEAYAKTSIRAGNEVRAMQEATSKAFDGVLAGIGKTTMQLEPLITGFAKVVEKLNEIGVAGPVAVGLLATAISGNPIIGGFLGLAAWAGGGDVGIGSFLEAGSLNKGLYNEGMRRKAQMQADAASLADAGRGAAGRAAQTIFGDSSSGLAGNKTSLAGKAKLVVVDKKNNTITVEILDPDEVQTYGRRSFGVAAAQGTNLFTGEGFALDRAFYQSQSQGVANENRTKSDALIDEAMRKQGAAYDIEKFQQGAQKLLVDAKSARNASFLESTFGTVDEFNVYAAAFDSLTGAVGSALGAWIDGSMSASKAFKAFIAEAVKGIAIQMAIEAIKHGAYAIGSLAMGNFAGAALHGKAAAGFAAGAVAASVAAKGLASGASGGSGSAPSAPRMVSTSPQATQGTAAVIVYGDQFAEDSPHDRQLKAKRMVDRALGGRQAVRAA